MCDPETCASCAASILETPTRLAPTRPLCRACATQWTQATGLPPAEYDPDLIVTGGDSIEEDAAARIRALDLPEVDRLLRGAHFWSPSYFIASTGGAPLEAIRKYVQDQGRKPRGPGRPRR